jgi:hypothetical protein
MISCRTLFIGGVQIFMIDEEVGSLLMLPDLVHVDHAIPIEEPELRCHV